MSFTRPQSCSVWGQENSVYLIKMGVLSGGAGRPGLLLPFPGSFLGRLESNWVPQADGAITRVFSLPSDRPASQ